MGFCQCQPQSSEIVLGFVADSSEATGLKWATPADQTPLTTKGDLFTFSTVDARLAVGTNGQVLTADSSEATGLKFATPTVAGFVGCSVFKDTSNQSLANDTDTVITFNAEEFDTDGFHDNVTNNSRITIPSGKGGKYLVIAQITFAANATGNRNINFTKNGTNLINGHQHAPTPAFSYRGTATTLISLTAGDYIECVAGQISGGSLNVSFGSTSTRFGVVYLGA